jgi:hypothetical protein
MPKGGAMAYFLLDYGLDFDLTGQGIQSWESLKNAWTDWNTLDCSINGVGSNSAKWMGTTGITVTCNTMAMNLQQTAGA